MKKDKQEQSFYMIIPATVYDAKIKDKAKLLYGHITSLCRQKGYCWASNDHLANLIGVKNKETASGYISDLKRLGVISTVMIYKEGSKEVEERRIYLTSPINQEVNSINQEVNSPINQKVNTGINQKVIDNNTTINNTTINIELDVPSVDNDIDKDFYGKIFFRIVDAYPKNRIGNRQHGLKKFRTLSKEDAKLAALNLKRYLTVSGEFVKTLQNYITEGCFTEEWLKAEETFKNKKELKGKTDTKTFDTNY